MFSRFYAVLIARNKEFLRDRSSLIWNLVFPILLIFGFAFALGGDSGSLYKVAVVGDLNQNEVPFLETRFVQFIPSATLEESLFGLQRHQVDMVISPNTSPEGQPQYWINSTSPKGYIVERLLVASQNEGSQRLPMANFKKGTVEGEEIRYVDWLVAGVIGMNMMFSALMGVGYVIVRYRKNGVLKRLKATPLTAFEFLSAQVVSRYLLSMGVMIVVYAVTHFALKFKMFGSYFDLFVVMSVGTMCLISLGLVISSRIKSEEFAGGLLNLCTWPMMILSGVWFSLEGAHPVLKGISKALPLTYVVDASRKIMTEGKTLAEVSTHVAVLAASTVVFLIVGSFSFKWE